MMPGEIKKAKVGDYCQITSSKRIYSSDYESTGVPFYRGKEIIEKQRGNLTVSTELFISEGKFRDIEFKFGVPKAGDLLLTSVGTLGIPYVVRSGEKFYFKDGNLTWFKNFKHLDSKFLYYWLLSPLGKAQLSRSTIGSSQPALTIVLLKQMEIELPSLLVQQKITAVLSAYDDLIENNTRRIAILEEMAQALYREWFVHFRFPGHTAVPLVEVDGRQIPEGWEVRNLGSLCKFKYGKMPKKEDLVSEGFPIFSGYGVVGFHKDYLYEDREIVVIARGVGRCGEIEMSPPQSWITNISIVIQPDSEDILKLFLYHRLIDTSLTGLNKGTAQPQVTISDLVPYQIILPPLELQKRYVEIASQHHLLAANLKQKNANLRQTRDLLLPRLISGELDVSHIPRRDVALQRLYHLSDA